MDGGAAGLRRAEEAEISDLAAAPVQLLRRDAVHVPQPGEAGHTARD